jgi:peptide/nickel transport system substrate-binding protein
VLRIVNLSDPDTLSPLVSVFQISADLSMFWGGYLFNYSDRNALVPELATTVPTLANGGVSRDGRTIRYHLRKGVAWQDGAPFTAADVVFTWHAIMNPDNNVSSRIGYDDITRIDTPDAYTAIVHLKKPYSPFVNSFLTMSAQPYPVYPRHLLAQYHDLNRVAYNSAPVGTGPFIVREWHRGEIVRMVANPHYWRGSPKLAEVDYQAIPDENTLLSTMQSHGADLWYNASATLYPQERGIAGTHVLLTPFTQYSYIGFNTSRPILRDVAVRRALALATDRKRLSETLAHGVPILAEGDQPPFSWAYDRTVPSIPYDPARARALLDADGWRVGSDGIRTKGGQRLRLEVATTTGNVIGNRLGVLLQNAWRQIGVDLSIKPYASALMFASYGAGGILQTGKFDVQFAAWLNGVDPDDSSTTMCDQIPPNGSNSVRFCDQALDAQQRIALTHYDEPTRKAAYGKIEHILVDQVPFLTQWFARRIDLVSDDLQGYRPAHAVTTFWNSWEYAI